MDKKTIKIPYLKNDQIEKKSIDLLVDYYNNNKNAPYCQFVIQPKLEKLNLVNQTQNPPLTQNAPDPHN